MQALDFGKRLRKMLSSAFLIDKEVGYRATLKTKFGSLEVPLPCIIGNTPQCDIYLNLPGSVPLRFVTQIENKKLAVFCADKKIEELGLNWLENMGVHLAGPYVKGGLLAWLQNAITWFEKKCAVMSPRFLRERIQAFEPGRMTAIVVIILLNVLSVGLLVQRTNQDQFSDGIKSHPISLDETYTPVIGASPTRKGYEKGVRFYLEVDDEALAKAKLLRLDVAAIDSVNEVSILVNNVSAINFGIDEICIDSICTFQFRLENRLFKNGRNVIAFLHNDIKSSYMLRNILVTNIPEPSTSDTEELASFVEAATRFFDERFIAIDNISKAFINIRSAEKLLGLRKFSEKEAARIRNLKSSIEQERVRILNELLGMIETQIQLKNFHQARIDLERLRLSILPNEDSFLEQSQRLTKLLQKEGT